MKLYDSKSAPNPRRTRIFLAEKGIALPTEQVDIVSMQHKTPEYTAINPLQRMPALVLDDGTIITELIAICRYFEVTAAAAAAVRRRRLKRSRWWKCGTGAARSISFPTWRRCSAICIRR